MSLVARHLESSGIPTIVVGSALDLMIEVGTPRALFVDYPLGNPCGRPNAPEEQQAILELALQAAMTAVAPRTIVQAPATWETDTWRASYMQVGDSNREELLQAGRERKAKQAAVGLSQK